jgi:hypothetical protein
MDLTYWLLSKIYSVFPMHARDGTHPLAQIGLYSNELDGTLLVDVYLFWINNVQW